MAFRVLVVEADHDGSRQTEATLLSAGYFVTCVSTFEEAKRRLLLAPPDLVVTDVRLGAYNGVHLLLRARAHYPSMLGIVQDVRHDPVLEDEVRNAGAVYVGKPLAPRSLVALVRRLVDEAKLQPRPSSAIDRRFPRKHVGVEATVHGAEATVVDASYGGFRLEVSGVPGAQPSRPSTVDIPSVGSVPVRPIWVRGAGHLNMWWCGVEVAKADQQTALAWRTFVDSLN